MKNVTVAVSTIFFTLCAQAQEFRQIPKPVLCGPVHTILKGLADSDVNEKPLWLGKNDDEKSDFAVFVNPQTGAFTILQFTKEWGCILGIGYKSQTLENFTKSKNKSTM